MNTLKDEDQTETNHRSATQWMNSELITYTLLIVIWLISIIYNYIFCQLCLVECFYVQGVYQHIKQHACKKYVNFYKGYNVTKRSWGYRPPRKFEVQNNVSFHSLLDNRRIMEKFFTEQDEECSTFIPFIQV